MWNTLLSRFSILYEWPITNSEGAVFDSYKEGISVHPEIMFPLVCSDHEIEIIAPVVKVRVSLCPNEFLVIGWKKVTWSKFISRIAGSAKIY